MAVTGLNRAQQSSVGAAPKVEQAAGPAAQPSNKPVQNKAPVGYSTIDTFQQASGAGATQQVAQAQTAPQTQPHMPTFSGTITSQPVSDADKVARGAIPVDSTKPAKTYDGMYLGADGYAYPPDKFKASEVPPFTPSKPLSNPPPTTYYVNGILTSPTGDGQASTEAQKLADKTGTNVVLVYNATEGTAQDIVQTGLDRIGQGDNAAANTLANAVYSDIKDGKKVNVVGYSQGGAIVSHALHMVDDHISNDQGGFFANLPFLGDGNRQARAQLLSNVNAVTFAGAGRDFPDGPKYTFYVNQKDPVPNWLGVHDFNFVPDITNAILDTIPGVSLLTGGGGYHASGAQIYTLDDPGTDSNLFSVDGSHGINTYFNHIDNSVP